MTRGHPDYGVGGPYAIIYPVLDIGELAARLGSPCTTDRAGNVLWYDDFEGTIRRWAMTTYNGEGDLQHTTEAARSGAASAKLLTPTTLNKDTNMHCHRPLPRPTKIGFEVSYSMGTNINYLYLALTFNDNTGRDKFQLRYDRYQTTLAYLNSAGGYTDLPGRVSHQLLYSAWNTIKLVADYDSKKYVRALLNNFSWSLKDIPCDSDTAYYTPSLYLEVRIQNRDANQRYIYVDDVILTQNEP